MARMKLRYLKPKMGELRVGDSGWVTPWMIRVSNDRRMFISKDISLNQNPGGTVNTLVMVTKDGVQVVQYDYFGEQYEYERQSISEDHIAQFFLEVASFWRIPKDASNYHHTDYHFITENRGVNLTDDNCLELPSGQ